MHGARLSPVDATREEADNRRRGRLADPSAQRPTDARRPLSDLLVVYNCTMNRKPTCAYTIDAQATRGFRGSFEVLDARGAVIASGCDPMTHDSMQLAWASVREQAQLLVTCLP